MLLRTVAAVSDTAPSSSSAAGSPGSGLRQLGLDSTTPLPAWVILNAVRNQAFSGEVTLHTMPAVRVWASDGTVYWAERAGATPVADRLVELGAISLAQMARGAVRLGDTMHLGRLFERVPNLDHDEIVNALGFVRDSLTAEVADLVTDRVDVVPGRHHASGIVFWFDAAYQAWPAPQPAPLPAPAPLAEVVAPAPAPVFTPVDELPPPAGPPADVVSAVRLALDEIRAALDDRATPPAPIHIAPEPTVTLDTGPVDTVTLDTGPVDTVTMDTVTMDTGPVDPVPVDTGLEHGPRPARRATRAMPVSYAESDPTDGEPTAPVVPITEATQPASGLRRLIGGRRG
jgi:hypothetical protein